MAITHPENPAPINEGNRCNALLWNCKGEDCDYHYEDAIATVCPNCGTPRRRCKAGCIKGREACKFHGGSALMGISHPKYKGGTLSKHLPSRLLTHYFEALENPDILNSTEDIGVLDVRIAELMHRLDQNLPPAEIWDLLGKRFREYRKKETAALNANSQVTGKRYMREAQTILEEIENLIINGYFADKTWDEIAKIMEQQRKLKETEQRRRKAAEEIITPEQFNTMLVYILRIIKDEVHSREDLKNVMDRIQGMRVVGM